MRRIVYQVCVMLTAIWMLTACEAELLPGDYAPGANGQLVFSIHALRGEIEEESLGKRSAGGESGIKQLHFVLFDENNTIVQPRSQQIAPDFSSLIGCSV